MVRMFLVVAALGGSLALATGGDDHAGDGGAKSDGMMGDGMMGDGMMGDGMMGDGMMGDHAGADSGHAGDEMGTSSQAFLKAMQDMDRAMTAAPMTGDADTDFARMMIAHHQGAIDMARVQVLYGEDPQMREVALRVIEDQTKEIAELERWLEGRQR